MWKPMTKFYLNQYQQYNQYKPTFAVPGKIHGQFDLPVWLSITDGSLPKPYQMTTN